MSPVVDIPNRPPGTAVRHIAQIIENFDALLDVLNGGLDEANFSSEGFIGPAALSDPLADVLGVDKVGTSRRGYSQVLTQEGTASTTYVDLATPHPTVAVKQPDPGLTFVFASVTQTVPSGASGNYTALQIDGLVNRTMMVSNETSPYEKVTMPGSQTGTFPIVVSTGYGAPWCFNLPGEHGYKMVHSILGGGTGQYRDRKLWVWTIGL